MYGPGISAAEITCSRSATSSGSPRGAVAVPQVCPVVDAGAGDFGQRRNCESVRRAGVLVAALEDHRGGPFARAPDVDLAAAAHVDPTVDVAGKGCWCRRFRWRRHSRLLGLPVGTAGHTGVPEDHECQQGTPLAARGRRTLSRPVVLSRTDHPRLPSGRAPQSALSLPMMLLLFREPLPDADA